MTRARDALPWWQRIRDRARAIKRDAVALWFAARHPETPWVPKAICVFVVAYALSPIDLIPDFIPVLGYVDDALLLPALIWLVVRLIPQPIVDDCRARAEAWMQAGGDRPKSYFGAVLIVAIWICLGTAVAWWLVSP